MDPTDPVASSPRAGDGALPSPEPDLVLDDLWERGEPPDIHSFLASWPDPRLSLDELLAVLRIDQRRRWLAGERVDLQSYRRDFPVLDQNSEALFELLYHELLIREDLGEQFDSAEYARAFPGLAERFELQLQIHAALSGKHKALELPAPPPAGVPTDREADRSSDSMPQEV